jgi:hypothetical protein
VRCDVISVATEVMAEGGAPIRVALIPPKIARPSGGSMHPSSEQSDPLSHGVNRSIPPCKTHQPRYIPVRIDGKNDEQIFVCKLLNHKATETILLVPDVHTTSFSFRHVAKQLHSKGFSVVTFDFPGTFSSFCAACSPQCSSDSYACFARSARERESVCVGGGRGGHAWKLLHVR